MADEKRLVGVELLLATVVMAVLLRPIVDQRLDAPGMRTWSTILVSICFQALPFLALGTVVSGLVAALVEPAAIDRLLPRRTALSVPAAGLAGMGLPGCECGSVPIAGRLMAGGVSPAVAVTFLLAAPAVNPVVMMATAVAFPGRPEMVAARFVASFTTAVVVGWIWLARGRDDLVARARRRRPAPGPRLEVFRAAAVHDLLHAGGYLVVGALAAATLQVLVPTSWLDAMAGRGLLAVLGLAVLAVVLCLCSEADAFVAASLAPFSPTAQLAFVVVGPAVDLKLVALQTGTFGRGFAVRFAPLTFAVAVTTAIIAGAVIL